MRTLVERMAKLSRTWVRAAMIAAGLIVTAALVAGDSARAVPASVDVYADRPMATLTSQFAPPPPLPGAGAQEEQASTDRPELTDEQPAWRIELPDADGLTGVAVTDAGYVVRTRGDRLVGLDRDGEQLWGHGLDRSGEEMVSEEVVLASLEHPTDHRQPDVVVALDPATGEDLWEEGEASSWTLFTDVVYMTVCSGGQAGEQRECRLSARDPLTNTVRWSVSTHDRARVLGADGLQARPVPPYLVVESFPAGHDSRTIATFDPETGRRLAAGFDGQEEHAAFSDVLVSIEDRDENPADGCTVTLTGYDRHSGRQAWQHVAATFKVYHGVYCGDQVDPDVSSGRLAVTSGEGRPVVLDAGTGKVVWTGPEPGYGVVAIEDLLLALELSSEAAELVLYELSSGEQRWRAPVPPGADPYGAVIHDRMVLTTWEEQRDPVGYDIRTGDWWVYTDDDDYGEPYVTFGPGWVAICQERECRGYEVR